MGARIRVSYAYERYHTRMSGLSGWAGSALACVLWVVDMPYAYEHGAYAYGQRDDFLTMFVCSF